MNIKERLKTFDRVPLTRTCRPLWSMQRTFQKFLADQTFFSKEMIVRPLLSAVTKQGNLSL